MNFFQPFKNAEPIIVSWVVQKQVGLNLACVPSFADLPSVEKVLYTGPFGKYLSFSPRPFIVIPQCWIQSWFLLLSGKLHGADIAVLFGKVLKVYLLISNNLINS